MSPWAAGVGGEVHAPAAWFGIPGEAFFGTDVSYRSNYNSDASVSQYTEIDGYALVSLRLGYRADNGWEGFFWVKNALDEDYLQFVSIQAGNSGLVVGNPGDPRTLGFTLRARY